MSSRPARLVEALADRARRADAAAELARALGADAFLALVRDPGLDVLVVAPGFSPTLPGGPAWAAFLDACLAPGDHEGAVPHPHPGAPKPARARTLDDGTVFVLLGAAATLDGLDSLPLGLLSALFRAEGAAGVARAEADVARDVARQSRALTTAVEHARAETAHALTEAARLNRELGREAELREYLLGIVSHDLRNPLAAITMAVKLMLRHGGLAPDDQKRVGRIAGSADRMARMISELLDLTRSRVGGGLEITRDRSDFFLLCRQAVDEAELAHPELQVDFVMEGDGVGAWDASRLGQVLGNLLGNAIQYGAPGAPVSLRAVGAGDVTLEVHNEGAPIPAELQAHLFEPFHRGPVGQRSRQGLGLGLYIASEIVKAHGGALVVRSTEAEGTTFRLTLPRGPGTPSAA